jgi:glycosyltransferase involved in cell wall biosynthesis
MTERALRVLTLTTYPEYAAGTRFRLLQFVPLLAAHGIELDVRPLLTNSAFSTMYDRRYALRTAGGILAGFLGRARDAIRLGSYDAVLVQREAAIIGPPVMEWLAKRRLPMVLDLDDATYLERPSDVYGSFVMMLKWPGKTDRLIRWSDHVVCGSPAIADHASRLGAPATVIPTLVDVDRFRPRASRVSGDVVIGWIGTHSTFAYLRTLLPVFRRLAKDHRFRLRIVGSSAAEFPVDDIDVDLLPWRMDREVEDLQSFDIAVYPIVEDDWAKGKAGFKAIQYLSCGIPYVASPVGVVAGMGVPGVTHLEASSEGEWLAALAHLLSDAGARNEMGRQGREYALAHYSTDDAAATLAGIIRRAAAAKRTGA